MVSRVDAGCRGLTRDVDGVDGLDRGCRASSRRSRVDAGCRGSTRDVAGVDGLDKWSHASTRDVAGRRATLTESTDLAFRMRERHAAWMVAAARSLRTLKGTRTSSDNTPGVLSDARTPGVLSDACHQVLGRSATSCASSTAASGVRN